MIKSWREALIPCWEWYNADNGQNAAGGNLHIVLDDGNLSNGDIEFCQRIFEGHINVWVNGLPDPPDERKFGPGATGRWETEFKPEERNEYGLALCDLLLSMSLTQ